MRYKTAQTKLTNIATSAVITLSDGLYPSDEHDWSSVVSSSEYTLTGAYSIQQGVKQSGRPYTMQAPDNMAWLPRSTINALREQCDIVGAKFWLDYLADGVLKRVKVMFDTSGSAISARPVKGYISPLPQDPFLVTLRFVEVN